MTDSKYLSIAPSARLPHSPFSNLLILAIENALRLAWAKLTEDANMHLFLLVPDEDGITEKLQNILESLRVNGTCPGYDCDTFERPGRESKFRNYNGETLKKMPDLIFATCGRPRLGVVNSLYDGIFVECKLLDTQNNKDLGLYARNGINRFLIGDYAWAMPHGMMLAYVRTEETLPNNLVNYLNKNDNKKRFQVTALPELCHLSKQLPSVYVSQHSRDWLYQQDGHAPGDIKIRHLWLNLVNTSR